MNCLIDNLLLFNMDYYLNVLYETKGGFYEIKTLHPISCRN